MLVGLGLPAAAAGYQWYLESDYYRARFEPKFRQLQAGHSHQRMRDVLGSPTHYCMVQVKDSMLTMAPTLWHEYYEIYRIAGYDHRVRFKARFPDEATPIVSLDVVPTPKSCLAGKHR